MFHLSSEDVLSGGQSYNGVFALSNTLSGALSLVDYFVAPGDIPWIYSGAEKISVTRTAGATSHFITFPETADSTPASVELVIEAAFDALGFFGGATVATFNLGTNAYDVVVSESISLKWNDSSATPVFKKAGVGTETGVAFSLPANFIDSRPKYIEWHITETSSNGISSHGSSADLFLATFDPLPVDVTISLSSSHTTLDVEVRRVNIIGVPCPMILKWDLMFKQG